MCIRDSVEEGDEDGAEAEGDGVVEERLADEEGEAEDRAARVAAEDGLGDQAEPDALALVDGDLTGRRRQLLALLLLDLPFDGGDERVGLLPLAVDELPAWALRHVPPDQQDDQAEDDAQGEAEPPAEVLGEDVGVQHHDGQQRAADRAEPVAAVDDEVDPAAVLGRDQLVDRRVDGRVLAADAEAGEEAEEEEPPGLEGERGQRGRREVDHQRRHEQLLAAVAVGQPAEEQGAGAGSRHVQGGGEAGDLRGADVETAALLGDAAGDVADDRDLQAVQDPDGAQADHDHPVPP